MRTEIGSGDDCDASKRGLLQLDGIFNVYKQAGMTSHDVVDAVRRLARQRRVGHAGTLDPAAEGVLLVCLGKATKVVEYLTNDRKVYRADIVIGVSTDTFDAEGRVVKRMPFENLHLSDIEEALAEFRGPITQVPPAFSAIKQGGRPLYELARRGMEVSPLPRQVTVYRLDVQEWRPPSLSVKVECSKGTYIRSIAHDLGERLRCGAHLGHLVREASGSFAVDTASTLDELAAAFAAGRAEDLLYALDEALLAYDALIVGESRAAGVCNGNSWPVESPAKAKSLGAQAQVRVYSVAGEIVAMAAYDEGACRWQPSKVF